MIYTLLILAHVLADFSFQTKKIAKRKKEEIRYLIKHLLIVLLASLFLTVPFFGLRLLIIVIVTGVTLFHGIIDQLKIYLLNSSFYEKIKNHYELEIFLVDQVLHILSIFFVISFFPGIQTYNFNIILHRNILTGFLNIHYINQNLISISALVLAILIFNFKGSTIIVRSVLKRYNTDVGKSGDKGEAIGNLERLLITFFIILESYALVGFMFTAKSLIRFKDIERKSENDFVEYYLIGSFISIFLGVISGIVIKFLAGI